MLVQITDYGVEVLDTNTGPVVLDVYKLGDGYNYVPSPTDTDIHGAEVFSGQISAPDALNANVMRYSMYLQLNLGPFDFGEVGIYHEGQLFALCAANALIPKLAPTAGNPGNSIRIDVYLSITGSNYNMWMDFAESNNSFRIASVHSVDQLPPSHMATPNTYIVQPPSSGQAPVLAFTDRQGLWAFDAYQYSTIAQATVTAVTPTSVSFAINDYAPQMSPNYFGEVILEFVTGQLYSICRNIKTASVSGNTATLTFDTPLLILPSVGDKFVTFNRTQLSTTLPTIPQATTTVLGGIKIGQGLTIHLDGTLDVDPMALSLVTSVNAMVGDVVIDATNLPLLAPVGITNDYNSLSNKPAPYALPALSQSVRGGARLPANGNLVAVGDVIDLGFAPVKTVNSQLPDALGNINVTLSVMGLINPTEITSGQNLNTFTTTGLFYVVAANAASLVNAPTTSGAATLEVVPLSANNTGEVVQRWVTETRQFWRKLTAGSWKPWVEINTQAPIGIATTATLGTVKIGAGLVIDGTGLLSVNTATLPVATTASLGVVRIGQGIAINGAGVISVDPANIPVATAATLGVVKIGAGLSIDSTGLLTGSPDIATTTKLGVIKVGAGLAVAGDGTLSTSFPIATTVALGVVKVGTGLSIDASGLLTGAPTIATTAATGVVQIGAGLSVTAGGLLSANVQSVNGVLPDGSGNIDISGAVNGLVNPQEMIGGRDLNTVTTTGLYFVVAANAAAIINAPNTTGDAATLEVVPLSVDNTGEVVQRWSTATAIWWRKKTGAAWSTWTRLSTVEMGLPTGGSTNQTLLKTANTDYAVAWQTLTGASIGLPNVENKSSSQIRNEITSGNVTTALGYAPTQVIISTVDPGASAGAGVIWVNPSV